MISKNVSDIHSNGIVFKRDLEFQMKMAADDGLAQAIRGNFPSPYSAEQDSTRISYMSAAPQNFGMMPQKSPAKYNLPPLKMTKLHSWDQGQGQEVHTGRFGQQQEQQPPPWQ